MKKLQVELKTGLLELTILKDGKLILGEYKGAKTNAHEIKKAMKRLGIKYGYLNNCISLVESGAAGEMPVAQAFIEDEPGEMKYHFKTSWKHEELLHYLKSGLFDSITLIQKVCRNDMLLSLIKTPSTVLKYPDGRREILHEHSDGDVHFYLGKNVRLGRDINTIVSNIDGIAMRDIFGVVSVLPDVRVNSIGKAHGLVRYEKGLYVGNDIQSDSDVQSSGSIFVGGLIRSAAVKAAGPIHASYGIDNPRQKESGGIEAGQSIFTSFIRNYRVHSSACIIVKGYIDKSSVQCSDTMAVPIIRSSKIGVGKKLYVNNIEAGCTINLGPYYIKDDNYNEIKNIHDRHLKRMLDMENDVRSVIERIRYEKQLALTQLQKMKKISPETIPQDLILNRFYRNLFLADKELDSNILRYEKQIDSLSEERLRLSFYERQHHEEGSVEIICLGTIAADTVIIAPNQTMKLDEPQENVSIKLDSTSGTLNIHQLN